VHHRPDARRRRRRRHAAMRVVGGRRTRRAVAALLLAAGLGAGVESSGSKAAAQLAPRAFTATADARVAGVNFTAVPPVLFTQLVDAGGAVAQAQIDSLGASTAFASTPYPSESVVLLPSLMAGLTGGATSALVPQYPLIVSSTYPAKPEGRAQAATVRLVAASDDRRSSGDVSDGVNRGFATVGFDPATEAVVAHAEAAVGDIQLAPALSLSGIRSSADVTKTATGELQRASSFEVGALTIMGQRVSVTKDGLKPGLVPLAPLLAQLAERGVSIEVLPAENTASGVISAGLRIRQVAAPPPELASGVEQLVAEITFGRVSADVTHRALGGDAGLIPSTPPVSGGIESSGGIDSAPSAEPSTPNPSPALFEPALPGPAVNVSGSESVAGPAPPVADPQQPPTAALVDPTPAALALQHRVDARITGFYPVLFFLAVVILVLLKSVRTVGVRSS
ncbi:MAG TPA: hypothetical protein VHL53_17645, partial [Acidimicrobiia bacterium]|nr:hypothetical protein [Acidimicrobiia bacterium]